MQLLWLLSVIDFLECPFWISVHLSFNKMDSTAHSVGDRSGLINIGDTRELRLTRMEAASIARSSFTRIGLSLLCWGLNLPSRKQSSIWLGLIWTWLNWYGHATKYLGNFLCISDYASTPEYSEDTPQHQTQQCWIYNYLMLWQICWGDFQWHWRFWYLWFCCLVPILGLEIVNFDSEIWHVNCFTYSFTLHKGGFVS